MAANEEGRSAIPATFDVEAAEGSARSRERRSLPPWLTALVLLAVYGWAVLWFAPVGFNPTDDGLMLAQADRVLAGEVPHLDFVTPRPVGSPLLHILDLVAPGPLLYVSRMLVLVQFLLIAVLVVRLLTDRPVRAWRVEHVALVVVTFVVDLHVYAPMSWHTIDGIMLGVLSLWLLEVGVRRRRPVWLVGGALAAGYAPLVKQSFVAVPLLALAWMWWWWRATPADERPGRRAVVASVLVMGIPGLAYLLWIVLRGGWRPMVDQLTSAEGVPVFPLWGGLGWTGAVILVPIALAVLVHAGRTGLAPWWAGDERRADRVRGAVAVLVVAAALAWPILWRLSGGSGTHLWWLAFSVVVLVSVDQERVDVAGVAMLALAWMVSLSWGYPVPNLFAGALLAVVLLRAAAVLGRVELGRTLVRRAGPTIMVVLAVGLLVWSVPVRRAEVRRDVPAADQTADLGDVAPALQGIRSNEVTAAYLAAIGACLEEHPAGRLAVVPDNPVVPLLFGRTNPLPVDWWYPPELPEDQEAIFLRLPALDLDGDYLVLFQTTDATTLASQPGLADATPTAALSGYGGGSLRRLFDTLGGDVVTCGPFVGRYSPAPAPGG